MPKLFIGAEFTILLDSKLGLKNELVLGASILGPGIGAGFTIWFTTGVAGVAIGSGTGLLETGFGAVFIGAGEGIGLFIGIAGVTGCGCAPGTLPDIGAGVGAGGGETISFFSPFFFLSAKKPMIVIIINMITIII